MIHTAYPDGVLTFDVVLEMAMSHVLNYSTDSDSRHAELAQLLRTARTLQRRIALCNSDSSELIDAALRKGIDVDAGIRGALRQVDELEKDLTTHHIYVLAAFVSPSPAEPSFIECMDKFDFACFAIVDALGEAEASVSRQRAALQDHPGNTTVDSEMMRGFMATGDASTGATTVPMPVDIADVGSNYSGSGSGSGSSSSTLSRERLSAPGLGSTPLVNGVGLPPLETPLAAAVPPPPAPDEGHAHIRVMSDDEVLTSLLKGQ